MPEWLRPLFVCRQWIDEQADVGRDQPGVPGELLTDSTDGLIHFSAVQACRREIEHASSTPVELAIDVVASSDGDQIILDQGVCPSRLLLDAGPGWRPRAVPSGCPLSGTRCASRHVALMHHHVAMTLDAQTPTPDEPSPFPSHEGDAYLAVAQARLDHQMATLDALDAKASSYLTASWAEAGLLVALLAIRSPDEHPLSPWSAVGLLLTAAALVGVFLDARAAMQPVEWSRYPSPESAWGVAHKPDVAWHLARSLEKAYTDNRKQESERVESVRREEYLLLMQTALTFVTALLILVT